MRACWGALTSTGGPAQASAVIKTRSTLSSPGPTGPRARPAPGTLARLTSLGRPAIMGVLNVTPDSLLRWRPLSRSAARDRACPADGRRRRRHPRYRCGIHPPLWRRVAVSREEELRRLAPVLPAVVALGVPVSIDTMKAGGRRLGARAGRRHRQRRLGPAARPRHGARGRRARRAGHHHAQSRHRRSDHRHHGRHRRLLRLARSTSRNAPASRATTIVLDPGIGFGKTPEQSMHAIAGSASFKHSACRSWSAPRASASSTRCRLSPPDRADRRLDRQPPDGGRRTAPRSSAPTTSPRPCRRCASPPPSGAPDDRPRLRQRARAARLSRRDAARGQGRADLQARSRARPRSRRQASRSDKLADTVGYDQVVDVASQAFCAKRYRLVEAAAGAVADAMLDRFPQVDGGAGHGSQAACADRRHLRRRRRHHLRRARAWLRRCWRSAAMSADVRDNARPRDRRALRAAATIRLLARSSDYRTPPWGVDDQPPFVNLCIAVDDRRCRRTRCWRARKRSSAPSAATARTSGAGGRARSTSTSWPMTTLPRRAGPDAAASARCSNAPSCWCRSPRSPVSASLPAFA